MIDDNEEKGCQKKKKMNSIVFAQTLLISPLRLLKLSRGCNTNFFLSFVQTFVRYPVTVAGQVCRTILKSANNSPPFPVNEVFV